MSEKKPFADSFCPMQGYEFSGWPGVLVIEKKSDFHKFNKCDSLVIDWINAHCANTASKNACWSPLKQKK